MKSHAITNTLHTNLCIELKYDRSVIHIKKFELLVQKYSLPYMYRKGIHQYQVTQEAPLYYAAGALALKYAK